MTFGIQSIYPISVAQKNVSRFATSVSLALFVNLLSVTTAQAQRIDQVPTASFRNVKMGGSVHRVEQVQVIGEHARTEQALGKLGKGGCVVIYPGEQHALVQQCAAGLTKARGRYPDFSIDLGRVIRVQNHD